MTDPTGLISTDPSGTSGGPHAANKPWGAAPREWPHGEPLPRGRLQEPARPRDTGPTPPQAPRPRDEGLCRPPRGTHRTRRRGGRHGAGRGTRALGRCTLTVPISLPGTDTHAGRQDPRLGGPRRLVCVAPSVPAAWLGPRLRERPEGAEQGPGGSRSAASPGALSGALPPAPPSVKATEARRDGLPKVKASKHQPQRKPRSCAASQTRPPTSSRRGRGGGRGRVLHAVRSVPHTRSLGGDRGDRRGASARSEAAPNTQSSPSTGDRGTRATRTLRRPCPSRVTDG